MKKIKYFIWPCVNTLIVFLCFVLFVDVVPIWLNLSSGEWGNIVYFLPILLLYFLWLLPTISILYAKSIRKCGRIKYLYCVYNAIAMILGLVLYGYTNFVDVTIDIQWLALFIYILLCEIISLIVFSIKDRKNENSKTKLDNDFQNR